MNPRKKKQKQVPQCNKYPSPGIIPIFWYLCNNFDLPSKITIDIGINAAVNIIDGK